MEKIYRGNTNINIEERNHNIEVHPNDILKNLRMIKQTLAGDVVVEDENE